MRFFFILTVWCISVSLSAQKSPVKFGEIPAEDLTMTVYNADTSASAVILVDYGKVYMEVNVAGLSKNQGQYSTSSNAHLVFERHVRIKVLRKSGLRWADVAIPLYHVGQAEERLTNLKGATYSVENGKTVATQMGDGGIFNEKFNKNINLRKFALPNVRQGSIIEYSYRINSQFLTNFPDWKFQSEIPVRLSEFWAIIPEYFGFKRYMDGVVPITTYDEEDRHSSGYPEKAHHWVVTNVPAFHKESFMPCPEENYLKINFYLSQVNLPGRPSLDITPSWQALNNSLLESRSFGQVLDKGNFLKEQTERVTAGITDPIKKVAAIQTYVRQNFVWNGYKDVFPDDLKDIWESKRGSASDINFLMGAMLHQAGLSVDMVLISTRDHGAVKLAYPSAKQFNYVISSARVNGNPVFVDATEKYLPFDILPERCLNGRGLMISSLTHGWVEIVAPAKAKSITTATMALGTDGSLSGKLELKREGYDAYEARRSIKLKGDEAYLKKFSENRNWEINSSEFQNVDKDDLPTMEIYNVAVNEHAVVAGDIAYINPVLELAKHDNPFKAQAREYPIDFALKSEKTFIATYTLDSAYGIEEMPQSKVLVLPGNGMRYIYNISQIGNVITVMSSLQTNKTIFKKEEYLGLREFFSQLVAKQAEQIVLRRK
jgi:hypothetical protein